MENSNGWLFFILFAAAQVGMYLAIRRHWLRTAIAATAGVAVSIVAITLLGFVAQANTIFQALFAGVIVGGLVSIGTLTMAWYFQSSEQRKQYLAQQRQAAVGAPDIPATPTAAEGTPATVTSSGDDDQAVTA
ncbi:MAG: hypothetical protein GYB67_19410 [Chloroflexi bacterium]|nr:hypothetical protein [Chloroflexota bacterium]